MEPDPPSTTKNLSGRGGGRFRCGNIVTMFSVLMARQATALLSERRYEHGYQQPYPQWCLFNRARSPLCHWKTFIYVNF